jgi:hypothetical protein
MFGSTRWGMVRIFSLASVITAFLYLPWFWAWTYYGSFVPYSLTAKGVSFDPVKMAKAALLFPITGLTRASSLDDVFRPAYAVFGGWPSVLRDVSGIVSWLCCFAWVPPFLRPVTRAMSLATFVVELYLNCVTLYIPGATLLVIVVLSLLLEEVIRGTLYRTRPIASSSLNKPTAILYAYTRDTGRTA